MAEPEIPSEFPYRERKRQAAEEEENMNKEDDSDDSDYSIGYDSDDPAFEILEGKADRKIWTQYYREWDESEGFDISVFPGTSSMAGIAQQYDHLTSPKVKQEYTELCKLAIKKFNSENDKMYAFEEIVTVNASFAAGTWYYFTFKARDATVDVDVDVDAIKTFQALVWHGINEIIDVDFCRLKKFLTNEDKKKMREERKKKLQQRREAVAKVKQDNPSLVKSFVPRLVIEELSKGTPGGRKAYPGFKIGIRYTCKLQENDKIFDTNIEKEDPLEFRIASGQLIKGWEIGVAGMRVGDKRRITIPPELGYGAKGDGGIVPPDSWLVIEVELIYVDRPTST
ncbi:hypothetical protein KY285_006039 [Solanum tuberosum]|nr:hypothetical protein KY289_006537 [Solanum tuberosum]KAH0752891.1 hypothetical protein KY285_006039 [Solanum tuberosum]